METFEVLDTFDCGETSLRTLAVSNDGRFLATGGDFSSGRVTIWDLTSRKVIKTHKAHTYDVSGLVFSPDGNLLPGKTIPSAFGTCRATSNVSQPQVIMCMFLN